MPRATLPTHDLLSLVGAGAAARAPQVEPRGPDPDRPNESKPPRERVARRSIQPKARAAGEAAPLPSQKEPGTAHSGRKQKFNCRIPPDLADSIRDCVVALSGPPSRLTIDGFAEEAFRREVERLRRLHHAGQPFERRPYNPRPGRPVA